MQVPLGSTPAAERRARKQQSSATDAVSWFTPIGPRRMEFEPEVTAARPRLLRLARAYGLPTDTAHEVVQETLLEAWRHLDALSDPTGFQAWLKAIGDNVCRRYVRAHHMRTQREIPLSDPDSYEAEDRSGEMNGPALADSQALDPAEELDRFDRETLLDRALAHLSTPAREAVELHYLSEVPQREVARQLGLTIAALEARLHRARRQLRQVLSSELRAEAEAFGLTMPVGDEMTAEGWRETRLWCPTCAQHRLRGEFEPLVSGRVNLRLRCSGCSHSVDSYGHVPLDGMRAFRPAYKRLMQFVRSYFQPGVMSGWLDCEACGAPQPVRLLSTEELSGEEWGMLHDHPCPRHGVMVATHCSSCGRHHADMPVGSLLWPLPAVQRFLEAHPRSIMEPEVLVDYQGRPAIRLRLAAVTSSARLTLFAHPTLLEEIGAFRE